MEENDTYKQKLQDLLGNYVDGWDIFKKADTWTYPVLRKPEAENNPDIPDNFMDLAKEVFEIIGRDKYGLDFVENQIQMVNQRQMLNAMVSGLPSLPYDHWSFGKRLVTQEWAYNAGMMGKLFEVIFSTDPALTFCMDTNTKTEQLLVIAHACIGHNSFSKGNINFKSINKSRVLNDVNRLKEFVRKCEEQYGAGEVEQFLDACHAWQSHAMDIYPKAKKLSPEQQQKRLVARFEMMQKHVDLDRGSADSNLSWEAFEKAANQNAQDAPSYEENILRYAQENGPALKPWQRQFIESFCELRQFFLPISTTQVMNEGWASYWHHRLMTDMQKLDLIDSGMYADFLNLHTTVAEFQPDQAHMNPYAFGFQIWSDIERICMDPTEEDYKWRPEIAGNKNWLKVFKTTKDNYEDESFIAQYLSPKLIRYFRLFSIHDGDKAAFVEVKSIHDEDGYKDIRQKMTAQYRFGEGHSLPQGHAWSDRPDIRVAYHDPKTFELVLHHKAFNGKPLDEKGMQTILNHLSSRIWQYPVVLQSIDETGKIVKTMNSKPHIGSVKVPNTVAFRPNHP